jgi:hypothetical protein
LRKVLLCGTVTAVFQSFYQLLKMRVSLYELEGKAKKTRKHLVLRFPSAKGKTGNCDYFYRATEE